MQITNFLWNKQTIFNCRIIIVRLFVVIQRTYLNTQM